MESNEREAKLKESSRQRATHGQMDDAYQPTRARALLTLCYNVISLVKGEIRNLPYCLTGCLPDVKTGKI